MNISGKKCLVIGASSGIGAELARQLAGHGCPVALVARREAELNSLAADLNRIAGRQLVKCYPADVTDFAAAPNTLHQITGDMDGLDVVVYAAGIMPRVGLQEYNTETDLKTAQVNFLGAIAWLNPVADRFTKAKAGVIVGLGSVAGDRGRRGFPVYQSTKAAFETYLEALRNRLAQHDVLVTTIKPGFINTSMTEGLRIPLPAGTPEKTASDIIAAIESGAGVVYTPGYWRWVMLVVRNLPSKIMRKLSF
jgi:short-subunit dehydrogenase